MKKNIGTSFEYKLNIGKNSNQSPREALLALPQLLGGNCQTNPPKHFFAAEDNQLPSSQKKPTIKLYSSASPVSNDSVKKRCSFSNWAISEKSEKPSKNHQSKTNKAKNLYSEIIRLYEKIDSLNLSPNEKEHLSAFSILCHTDEKSLIHQKVLNADNFESAIEENSKESQIESNEISQNINKEIIAILKQEIDKLNKRNTKFEELYCTDTNILKKKIESQKIKYKQLEIDYKNICEKHEKNNINYECLLEKMHDTEKNYKAEIDNYINQINQLNEKSACTNLEIINTVEYMQKIKSDKKENEIHNKEKNEKIENLIEYNNGFKTQITNLTYILKNTLSELGEAKKTIEMLEIEIKQLKDVKRDYLVLEEKLKFTSINLEFANANYRELQQSYAVFRDKAIETESSLRLKIEKISPNSPINSSSQSTERSKLRRYSTQASKITENLSQKSLQNFTKKISNLDDELLKFRHELDKSNKDLAYSRKQLEEKKLLISHLESKNKDFIAKNSEEVYKSSILNFAKFLMKQKKILESAFLLIKCEECENEIISSTRVPCGGSSQCRKVIITEENCAKCSGPLKKAKLAVMMEVIKSFKQKYANGDEALAKTFDQVFNYC